MNNTTKEVIDALTLQRILTRIIYEIIERNHTLDNMVFIGIKTNGIYIARRLANRLHQLENIEIPVGELDTKSYRDDIIHTVQKNISPLKDITSVEGKEIVLIDDVLFTGRTVRAAMDALMPYGRPKSISLVVLIDRGHREYPIRADHVGKNIPTSLQEKIIVEMQEIDGQDRVLIA